MSTVSAAWLTKGYCGLRNDGLMRDVRDMLEKSLRMPKGSLHVRMYVDASVCSSTRSMNTCCRPLRLCAASIRESHSGLLAANTSTSDFNCSQRRRSILVQTLTSATAVE
jgi:hypothetical protein